MVLAITLLMSPLAALAQATWGSDQPINDAGHNGYTPQVAMSGSNAVAVWRQWDNSNTNRIYSSHSADSGATWDSDQLIEDNAGYEGEDPQVAISGSNAVAVWMQYDSSEYNRIYSNYSSDSGASWNSDQPIGSSGHYVWRPQVAVSGTNAVAVWERIQGAYARIYSNYSSDGGVNWSSEQLIEDNAGYYGYDPQVAMSGSSAVAVWWQSDGSNYRIYSNYCELISEPPVVGGEVYPVSKVTVLAPYFILALAIITVIATRQYLLNKR